MSIEKGHSFDVTVNPSDFVHVPEIDVVTGDIGAISGIRYFLTKCFAEPLLAFCLCSPAFLAMLRQTWSMKEIVGH